MKNDYLEDTRKQYKIGNIYAWCFKYQIYEIKRVAKFIEETNPSELTWDECLELACDELGIGVSYNSRKEL